MTEAIDRFLWSKGDVQLSSCIHCKHKYLGRNACKAFPGDIPYEISSGKHKHIREYPGDRGIRFERIEDGD